MIFENIRLAIIALKMNKLRSLLTMLGMIIGIAAVIAIVNIGNSMTASVNASFSSFGANNITAYVREKTAEQMMQGGAGGMSMMGGMSMGGMSMGGGMPAGGGGGAARGGSRGGTTATVEDSDKISLEMIEEFKEAFPDEIDAASVSYTYSQATANDGDLYSNVTIMGVNSDYEISDGTVMLTGRYVNTTDHENNRKVAIVSDKFVTNLFPGYDYDDVIDEQIKVYLTNVIEIYTIIGVYEYDDSATTSFTTETDADLRTNMYIPLSTAQENLLYKNHTQMTIVVNQSLDVLSFMTVLEEYFNEVYSDNQTWGITLSSRESQLSTITESMQTIAITIAFIAGISLVVGGIGIMNIMLVSVTERTREIGVRKALGAKHKHIRIQFITESAIISALGGTIGAILGTACGVVGSNIMDAPVQISIPVILVSVVFSMVVGIFFGFYPSNKAAMLNPIDALRYE